MIPVQVIHPSTPETLLENARRYWDERWRLVQICCTPLADLELSYSFAKGDAFEHLRIILPREHAKLPSISPVYSGAFSYENEIHDLFGIQFDGLTLFYNGAFFKTSIPTPFKDAPCVLNPALPKKTDG